MSAVSLIRAFIAIPTGKKLAQTVERVQSQLRSVPNWHPAQANQLHLTLFFFASLGEEQVETLRESMLSIGRSFAPFELEFGPVGAFPSRERPRVVWLGCSDPQKVMDLHRTMTQRFRQDGIPLDRRPFRPHLTVGRMRSPSHGRLQLPETVNRIKQSVDRLILYESCLSPKGAMHRPLASVLLTGAV